MKELRRYWTCDNLDDANIGLDNRRIAPEDRELIVLTPEEFEEMMRESWETAQEMDGPESFSHHFNSWFKERKRKKIS